VAPKGWNQPVVVLLWHTTVVLVLLTIGYYLLPLRAPWADVATGGRVVGSVLAWGALLLFLRVATRRSRERQPAEYVRIQWLLTALYLLVLGFSLVYAITATVAPTQFNGMENRSDALYFSVTTTATVGFGDIHASGTPARLMVTAQMLFNLIYIGTALRILSSGLSFPKPDPTQDPRQD
jgi:hypothetical protein